MQCQFGPFLLDVANAQLWHGDTLVKIRPKSFDVLAFLVARAGELVTTDELLDAVWGEMIVGQAVVKTSIRELRQALGETARDPLYIATVHRRGYRFMAQIAEAQEIAPEAPLPERLPDAGEDEPEGHDETLTLVKPSTPDSERRQLTILFCDLIGSPSLSAQLDPEDLNDVLKAYYDLCGDVIARFEGHVAQYLGDGLLVYFGYPLAHEDAARRAVHAGLEIMRSMPELNQRLQQEVGLELSLRIGIHTGLVMIGQGRADGGPESLAVGAPVNLTARIQSAAPPDAVWVSEATYSLIQGYFEMEERGLHDLSGLADPMRLYQVTAARESQHRLDVQSDDRLTPFVGREMELMMLQACWESVKRGQGQVVILNGEAGIGKSRLSRALLAAVADEPHLVLEGHCSPYHQHTAFYPLVNLIRKYVQQQSQGSAFDDVTHLDHLARRGGLDIDQSVPLMADLMSLPLSPGQYPDLAMTPQQQRRHTLETLLNLFIGLSQNQPVILFIEDIHWLDPSTLEWLHMMVDQGPTSSILTLLTGRPDFDSPWQTRSHVTTLTLKQLLASQINLMVQSIAGSETMTAEVIHQISSTTDGVPLFVEEMTRLMLTSPSTPLGVSRISIPATLQDLLMARLDSVGLAKRTAQIGATIGREFPFSLLRDISPLEADPLQNDLLTLVKADLLYQRGSGQEAWYQFKHSLIQDTAYQSLLRRTRQQVHAQVAQLLESRFDDIVNTQPELLAHHYTEAGDTEQAVIYWRQAGRYASEHSALREAVMRYDQALNTLQQLPPSIETSEQTIDLHLAIRTALIPLGDSAPIFSHMHSAGALAEQLGDVVRQRRIAVYWIRDLALTGRYEEALQWGQRALELSQEDVALRMMTQLYLGQTYYYMGAYQDAVSNLHDAFASEKLVPSGDQPSSVHLGASIPAVNLRYSLINALTELGRFEDGMRYGQEALNIAEPTGHQFSLYQIYSALASLSLWQGNLEPAIASLMRCLDICQEADQPYGLPYTLCRLGGAYVLSGRLTEALPYLEQTETLIESQQTNSRYVMWAVLLSEAYASMGNLATARPLAQEAYNLAKQRQERGFQGYALRLLGKIASQDEDSESQSTAYYQQALDIAQELGMRPLQAHCHHGLGTLYANTGQQQLAHEALTIAIELYRTMEMSLWIPQAQAVLSQLNGQT